MGARLQVPAALAPARGRMLRRAFGVAVGAAVVAASAQVVVPVPFSPVPMTLQPLAVLAVGGVLGAAGGASSLALYLALGLLGLPVFAGGGKGGSPAKTDSWFTRLVKSVEANSIGS